MLKMNQMCIPYTFQGLENLFLCCSSALPSPSLQRYCQNKFNPIGRQKNFKATLKVIKLENNPWLINEWVKAGERNGGGRGNVDF